MKFTAIVLAFVSLLMIESISAGTVTIPGVTIDCPGITPQWNPNSSTVTCSSAGTPPVTPPVTPPSGGNFVGCPADTLKIDGQWGNTAINTTNYGSFGGNIVSVRIVVPKDWNARSTKTSSWGQWTSGATSREFSVSTKPCDFDPTTVMRSADGMVMRFHTQYPTFYYAKTATGSVVQFNPGGVYYFNMRNRESSGANSCPSGDCNMRGGLPN